MAAIEERMALLEGRMLEQTHVFADIRETLRSLDQRLDGLDQKVGAVHQSLRRDAAADFKWIVGIQVTTLIAVVAALFGVVAAR